MAGAWTSGKSGQHRCMGYSKGRLFFEEKKCRKAPITYLPLMTGSLVLTEEECSPRKKKAGRAKLPKKSRDATQYVLFGKLITMQKCWKKGARIEVGC